MKKIIYFIKYHNAFTIGLALLFVFGGAILASEDIRENVIGEKIVTEQGIDNKEILSADIDNFDFQMTIGDVLEDDKNYYVNYFYRTLAIANNSWQPILKEKTLTVPKEILATTSDLGFYAQEELGEVIGGELAFLKKVQKLEKEKGLSQIVRTIAYTGLAGLVLDIKTMTLPGYEPPVRTMVVETVGTATESPAGNGEVEPPAGGSTSTGSPQEVEPQNISTPTIQNGANRPCSSQVGACRIGVQIYTDGVWGDCMGAVFPTEEIEDGVDNDCDGEIDEGLSALPAEAPMIIGAEEGDGETDEGLVDGNAEVEPPAGGSTSTDSVVVVSTTTDPVTVNSGASDEFADSDSISTQSSTTDSVAPEPLAEPIETSTSTDTNATSTTP